MAKALERLEEYLSKILLVMTVILVFVASLARWVGYPIVWSVDIAQLLFIWVCFLGANQALRRGEHIGVDFIVRYFPENLQRWLRGVHNLLIMAFLGTMVWYGIKLTTLNVERRFSDTDLSYAWVTVAVPVGCFLLLVTLLRQIRLRGRKEVEKTEASESAQV